MGRNTHAAHVPVKIQNFLPLGISCELGKRKNWTKYTCSTCTCENTVFRALWNKLRIREYKKWDEIHMQHMYL